jgi:glycosyltransferase involved in cell wall biosynthesis
MRLLWDVRFLSTGYKNRGIGVWACRMLELAYDQKPPEIKVVFLGCKSDAPAIWHTWDTEWIHYKPINWKYDLFLLPLVSIVRKIDCMHHWVVLGPLFQIGISIFASCKRVAVVHDLGVELWNEVPFLAARKKSLFWRVQKYALANCTKILTNSESVRKDLTDVFPKTFNKSHTVLVPLEALKKEVLQSATKHILLTLGGSPTKNVSMVVKAFGRFLEKHPNYTLAVGGELEKEESDAIEPHKNIVSVTIPQFFKLLPSVGALIVCSTREGLGLPILDAFSVGCPLVVSTIPVFSEIVSEGGIACDPTSVEQMALALMHVVENNDYWRKKSLARGAQYTVSAKKSVPSLWEMYSKLTMKL